MTQARAEVEEKRITDEFKKFKIKDEDKPDLDWWVRKLVSMMAEFFWKMVIPSSHKEKNNIFARGKFNPGKFELEENKE